VDFGQAEPHTVLFHEPGSSSVWVGGRGKVYIFDFPEGKNASVRTVSLDPMSSSLSISPLFCPLVLVRPSGNMKEVISLSKQAPLPPSYRNKWFLGEAPKGSPD
jgi:hypothetical protein